LPPRLEWIRQQIRDKADPSEIGRGLINSGLSEKDAKYLWNETFRRSQTRITNRRRSRSVQRAAKTKAGNQEFAIGGLFFLLAAGVAGITLLISGGTFYIAAYGLAGMGMLSIFRGMSK